MHITTVNIKYVQLDAVLCVIKNPTEKDFYYLLFAHLKLLNYFCSRFQKRGA